MSKEGCQGNVSFPGLEAASGASVETAWFQSAEAFASSSEIPTGRTLMQAILHNVRSVYNVASIFRTSDGLGVEKLYLSGYTPAPTDRFGRKRDKFHKVALGAERSVSWESIEDVKSHIKHLQKQNILVLACEPTEGAVDYRDISLPKEACLLFGNEPDGLPEEIIDLCDQVIAIPMQGEKTSLNVSVAFGIMTSHMIDNKK